MIFYCKEFWKQHLIYNPYFKKFVLLITNFLNAEKNVSMGSSLALVYKSHDFSLAHSGLVFEAQL